MNPRNDALFPRGGCKPLLTPNAPLDLIQQVTGLMVCSPLPPECKFPEGRACVCLGRLMATFPVSWSLFTQQALDKCHLSR